MSQSGARVALVTGAGHGIGRATALRLARERFEVACFDRDRERLEETARLIAQAGSRGSVHLGDAASHEAVESFGRDAVAEHGGADVVVNNVGMVFEATVEDTSPAEFRDHFNVNVVAGYTLARTVHPSMRERGGGVIVNIGSVFGSIGVPTTVPYCTAKAAVDGLTRALAAEWARDNIRVVCVAPGYVDTDMSKSALGDPETASRILARVPLGRPATANEIAAFVGFLVSDDAAFMTGETYVVDGGQRMAF